jgi:hypothetical protein
VKCISFSSVELAEEGRFYSKRIEGVEIFLRRLVSNRLHSGRGCQAFRGSSDQEFCPRNTRKTPKTKLIFSSEISFASVPVFRWRPVPLALGCRHRVLSPLIRVIHSPLLFLSIGGHSCPFVVGFLRLDLVGPEKLPRGYRIDCD